MGIIDRNIAALETKYLTNIDYEDIDYRGFNAPNNALTIKNGTCFINDLRLWIQSTKGDYYRRYNMGGYFDNYLRQFELNNAGAEELKRELTNRIQSEFPSIAVLLLEPIPDFIQRRWSLKIVVQDTLTGIIATTETAVATEV